MKVLHKRIDWPFVSLLTGVAAYLYINLFYRLTTPVLLGGDQVFFWTYAERLMDGERVYQDFFQFTPPGTDLVFLGLFRLLGTGMWVTNATVAILGLALCWLCFTVAAAIMRREFAFLTTVCFLVLVYGKTLNATHHWFSVLAILAAMQVVAPERIVRVLAAGALLGLASFFTHTHGAVALTALMLALLLFRWRKGNPWSHLLLRESALLAGYFVALLLLNAHYLAAVGFARLWYFEVTFVRQYALHVSQGAWLGLPQPLAWRNLASLSQYLVVYLLLLIVYPVSLWRCWRERRYAAFAWERVVLLGVTGMLLSAEVALNMNWLRVFAVSLPGVILLFWNLDRGARSPRSLVLLLWVGLACIGLRQTAALYLQKHAIVQVVGGDVATSPQSADKLRWLMLHTAPGQFFLQADWPGMYLPLRLRNPIFMDDVTPGDEGRPDDVTAAIRQLEEKRVRYVLWRGEAEHAGGAKAIFRRYLQKAYSPAHIFQDGDVIWERNPLPGDR